MPWYCLQTHAKREFQAQENCHNQGFKTFLPTYQHQLPKKGLITRPLFASYLFVQFDPNIDIWYPLCHTIGVKKLFANKPPINKHTKEYGYITPIPVPDNLILTLQDQMLNPPTKSKIQTINPGTVIKVKSGPFQDHTGICSWSNDKRIALLMNIMNGSIQVEFAREDIELV